MIQPKMQEVWFPPIDDDLDLKYLMYHTYEPRILHLERKIVFSEEEFEQFKREFGRELLEKAAENAKTKDVGEMVYNYFNEGNDDPYWESKLVVNKKTITDILDDFLKENKL